MMKEKQRIGPSQKSKSPPTSEDLDDLLNKDTQRHTDKMSKIRTERGAASATPADFDASLDVEECTPLPESAEPLCCYCGNPKWAKIYITRKKGKNFGRSFHICPTWNEKAPCWKKTCNFFKWV